VQAKYTQLKGSRRREVHPKVGTNRAGGRRGQTTYEEGCRRQRFRFVDQSINGCHAWNVLNETSAFPGFLVLQTMEDCDTDTEEELEEHQSENNDA